VGLTLHFQARVCLIPEFDEYYSLLRRVTALGQDVVVGIEVG
jgi:hypothetical protein